VFIFQLWREYKLSIAELIHIFPRWKILFFNEEVLVLKSLKRDGVLEKAKLLWWTIKIMEALDTDSFEDYIIESAARKDGKFSYGISSFWERQNLKSILNGVKSELRDNDLSSRYVNKDFQNLSSAQIIGEGLIESESDFNIIETGKQTLHALTIWVQDIETYAQRDYGKKRDMIVGMLPPKLCQMMINISRNPKTQSDNHIVYDPFVGLGTLLIESLYMWNTAVYGSDLNENMVKATRINLWNIKKENIKEFHFALQNINAKDIEHSKLIKSNKIDAVVSEWYLWEIMTRKNISIERIEAQREILSDLYEKFFQWLQNINYKWSIVICFPFWEINWKYFYFEGIYDILSQYCQIQEFFPSYMNIEPTKTGSLLYKREKQLVGREIFKLKIK